MYCQQRMINDRFSPNSSSCSYLPDPRPEVRPLMLANILGSFPPIKGTSITDFFPTSDCKHCSPGWRTGHDTHRGWTEEKWPTGRMTTAGGKLESWKSGKHYTLRHVWFDGRSTESFVKMSLVWRCLFFFLCKTFRTMFSRILFYVIGKDTYKLEFHKCVFFFYYISVQR